MSTSEVLPGWVRGFVAGRGVGSGSGSGSELGLHYSLGWAVNPGTQLAPSGPRQLSEQEEQAWQPPSGCFLARQTPVVLTITLVLLSHNRGPLGYLCKMEQFNGFSQSGSWGIAAFGRGVELPLYCQRWKWRPSACVHKGHEAFTKGLIGGSFLRVTSYRSW